MRFSKHVPSWAKKIFDQLSIEYPQLLEYRLVWHKTKRQAPSGRFIQSCKIIGVTATSRGARAKYALLHETAHAIRGVVGHCDEFMLVVRKLAIQYKIPARIAREVEQIYPEDFSWVII